VESRPTVGKVQPRRKRKSCKVDESQLLTYRYSHVAQIESNYNETIDSFDGMALKSELVRGLYNYGFERPSAVQQRVIAPVMKGKRKDGGDAHAAHELSG
jgi:superfamily II DNA/RNA helicase